jgi:hypothetical protein
VSETASPAVVAALVAVGRRAHMKQKCTAVQLAHNEFKRHTVQ